MAESITTATCTPSLLTMSPFKCGLPFRMFQKMMHSLAAAAPQTPGAYRGRVARQSSGTLASIRCASARSTGPMENISILAPCEAAGTIIMVATRR